MFVTKKLYFASSAAVYGYNKNSLGVCLIGKNNFKYKQLNSLFKLLKSWQKIYPQAKIVGHKDFPNTTKTCPNFDVKKWWRNRIQNEKKLSNHLS